MAVALAGQAVNNATGTPTTLALTRTTASGSLLIITASWNTGATTAITISDSTSGTNVWTRAAPGWKAGSTGTRTEIWYVINAAAITSATITVPSLPIGANLAEFTGFGAGSFHLGTSDTVGGTSVTPTTPTLTPASGELVIANQNCASAAAITTGVANSYVALTQAGAISGNRCAAAYKLSSSTSESETWTITSANWGAALATFTPAGAAGPDTVPIEGGGYYGYFRKFVQGWSRRKTGILIPEGLAVPA